VPQLRLLIVGQNSYPGLTNDVPGLRLCGHISREELQRLFQESALFAMPAYSEPWGMVYLEALISKTPILGLRRTALPEFTGNGRWNRPELR
jgi:glycosyltransferase involved in cell wall biosynthesis